MKQPAKLAENIFSISTSNDFNSCALEVFQFQAFHNKVYREYMAHLKIDPAKIKEVAEIPFLPVEFFKTHAVISGALKPEITFLSSATTGSLQSKHAVVHKNIYEKSYLQGFMHFYGKPDEYCILALLPSYLERKDSSLIYMVRDLIKKSGHAKSGFYLYNHDELYDTLMELKRQKQKTILVGVSFALLDFAEHHQMDFESLIVMETGGMKGKREELIREELHGILCKGFGVKNIHSEYGMTELLSQAYSKSNGLFECVPWMQVWIGDTLEPQRFLPDHRAGAIHIIDLANIYSCSFIATQDIGKRTKGNLFEVLGRFDSSDVRGCNLMAL